MLVQPHLECCAQFWAPQLKNNVKVPELMQKRATTLMKELEGATKQAEDTGCAGFGEKVKGDLHSLYSLLRRGSGQEGPEHFPWHPVRRYMGRAQSNVRGGSDLTV